MMPTLTAVTLMALTPMFELPTAVWQVAPSNRAKFHGEMIEMKKTKSRAAIVIHGILMYPLRPEKATRPELQDYMESTSDLVLALAPDFDVYSFSYAQTVVVDAIAHSDGFTNLIVKLNKAGYEEIVLIGHSAGGLIARQYAEGYPKAGVTKVIAICTPNLGSDLATIHIGVPKPQIAIVQSLAPIPRAAVAAAAKPLSPAIDFCCVVGKVPRLPTDTLVGLDSQWPADLQKQGIPASLVAVDHFDAMKAPQSVAVIAELAREKLVRWTPAQIEQGRAILFGKEADEAAIKKPGAKKRPILKKIGDIVERRVIDPFK